MTAECGPGSLPASGRLLVASVEGSWVVHRDGSKRFLGDYRESSWSPKGKFVVGTRGHELFVKELMTFFPATSE